MNHKLFTLITGASEGFGKGLAMECAKRKMNLILVALPSSGLPALSCFIEKNFSIEVHYFEADLTNKCEYISLFNKIQDRKLAVRILINNAGMGGTHLFEEREAEFYFKQIELNVMAPTLITRLFLKNLEENSPAFILNVSSLASFFYLPKKQVYGGTKSYLVSFSKSLRRELKQKNISVSTVCPGGMNTTLKLTLENKNLKGISRWSVMNPEDAAVIAIDGLLKGREIIVPGFWNRFFLFLDSILPKWIKVLITENQMKKSNPSVNQATSFLTPLKSAS